MVVPLGAHNHGFPPISSLYPMDIVLAVLLGPTIPTMTIREWMHHMQMDANGNGAFIQIEIMARISQTHRCLDN